MTNFRQIPWTKNKKFLTAWERGRTSVMSNYRCSRLHRTMQFVRSSQHVSDGDESFFPVKGSARLWSSSKVRHTLATPGQAFPS